MALLTYLVGFEPDAPRGMANFNPHLPPGWDFWEASPLLMGENRFSLRLEADTRSQSLRVRLDGAKPIRVCVKMVVRSDGTPSILVDGAPTIPAREKSFFGQRIIWFEETKLQPGEEVVFKVEAS